jgi:hypothetical protein
MTAIEFLTRTGQTSGPHREFTLISNVLGVSTLVDALNNPRVSTETESSNLGPFFTEDAPEGAWRLCADGPSPWADALPCSPARRIDRIGGEGRVYVRRGTGARH